MLRHCFVLCHLLRSGVDDPIISQEDIIAHSEEKKKKKKKKKEKKQEFSDTESVASSTQGEKERDG